MAIDSLRMRQECLATANRDGRASKRCADCAEEGSMRSCAVAGAVTGACGRRGHGSSAHMAVIAESPRGRTACSEREAWPDLKAVEMAQSADPRHRRPSRRALTGTRKRKAPADAGA
jgi:hypothetical protein